MASNTSQTVLAPMELLKAAFFIFVPSAVLLALVLSLFSYTRMQSGKIVLEAHEWSHVETGSKFIHHEFAAVASTLSSMVHSVVLKEFLSTGDVQDYADLGQDYLTLSRASGLYDQVRFLDADGMEVVRVNFNQGQPHLLDQNLLQNKRSRYYFGETFSLSRGEIFISPLDLNIEHGEVEIPRKPMIRFGAPVFDESGAKRGIVTLNYLGQIILKHLQEVMKPGIREGDNLQGSNLFVASRPLLVNDQGYWLLGLRAEDEWGFMFKNQKLSMAVRYPQAWQMMNREDEGQVVTDQGMFTFRTIHPVNPDYFSAAGPVPGDQLQSSLLRVPGQYSWKLVSFVPKTELSRFYWSYLPIPLMLYGVLLFLLVPVSYYLGRLRLLKQRAEESLRRYAFIVNKSRDPMTLIDDGYRYLAVSDSFCQIHDVEREDIVGATVSAVWGADVFVATIKPYLDRCLAGELVSYSAWFTMPMADMCFYDVTLSPFQSQNQKNHYAVVISRDITARKTMEEKLLRVKRDWEETFNAVPDLIALLDTDFQMIRVNRAMADALGRSPEECVGRICYEEVHNLSGPPPGCPHVRLLADGQHHAAEVVEDRLGGDFLLSVSPLHDSKGRLTGSVHIARDITKSNRARQRLEGLKKLQETLLHKGGLQDKLQLITDEVVTIFNADFARIWLVAPGDQCQSGCFHADMVDGVHTCQSHDACLHLMASSGRYRHLDGEGHGRVPLGSYKIGRIGAGVEKSFITNDVCHDPRVHNHEWARELGLQAFAGYRLIDRDGRPLGVLALFSKAIISDEEDAELAGVASSTAQVIRTAQAEGAMVASHARLQAIIDNVDAMIYITDIDTYEILMMNLYGRNLFGDVTGQKCWQAIQQDQDGPCSFCGVADLNGCDVAHATPVWEVQNTRNQRWYECHDTKISWIDDRSVRLQILTDITERKETEVKLHNYASVQKTLLREVNHRVKNNLAAIIGMLYMEEERAGSKKVVDYRETLHELISRIQGLATVHSLLSASEWQPIALSYLCEEVAGSSLSGLPPGKNVDLIVQTNGVYIDANQAHYLALVINELTTNTIKHGLLNRDRAEIAIKVVKDDGPQLTLSFQDDGPGYSQAICDGDLSQVNIGMEIVEGIITSSLRGTVTFSNSGGAETLFSFKNDYMDIGKEEHDEKY